MGTCYGVVPYVDSPNTGSVAGIVGAGGNVGAALLGLFFIKYEYNAAMEYMGWFTIGMGLLTPLVVVSLFLLFLCLVLSRFSLLVVVGETKTHPCIIIIIIII